MARLVLEGTWEEIAAHAQEFVGKRLRVIVGPGTEKVQELETMEEEAVRTRQELADYMKRNPHLSDSEAIVRYGRCGPMYGMPFVDDTGIEPKDEPHTDQ